MITIEIYSFKNFYKELIKKVKTENLNLFDLFEMSVEDLKAFAGDNIFHKKYTGSFKR